MEVGVTVIIAQLPMFIILGGVTLLALPGGVFESTTTDSGPTRIPAEVRRREPGVQGCKTRRVVKELV